MSKWSRPAVNVLGNVVIRKPCRTLPKFEFTFMQIILVFQNTISYGSNRPRGHNLTGRAFAVTVVGSNASMCGSERRFHV